MSEAELQHEAGALEVEQNVSPDQPRILVVDDSRTMRKAMRRLLGDDFDVIEAEDGDVAWDMISEDQSIQTVFSDLMMPNMNGFHLLRNVRESVHTRINQLPVIIITGHNDDEKMRKQAMSLGATDFITKPFDSVQLKARAKAHTLYDETARKLEQATVDLETRTTIDPLTGLANLRYFTEHGPQILALCVRQGTPLSVLRINVDKYDVLFQKKGKQVAEKVLVNVGRIISSLVKKEDSVARVGVSKFSIMMPGTGELEARAIAEKIQEMMQQTGYRMGHSRFRMTVSTGLVSPLLDEDMQFDELLKVAETRLARATEGGGDQVVSSEEDSETATPVQKSSMYRTLTLDQALSLLKAGDAESVQAQLPALMMRTFPLLVFANKTMHLGWSEQLNQLRDVLKSNSTT